MLNRLVCFAAFAVGAPLTDPSNEVFAKVIAGWNAISKRIYIWNYVVDFGDLVMSFPNYYSLGSNVDFFAAHGVRGIFQEGPGYSCKSSEFQSENCGIVPCSYSMGTLMDTFGWPGWGPAMGPTWRS